MRLHAGYAYSGEIGGNQSDNCVSSTGRSSLFANDSVRNRAAGEEKSGEGECYPEAIRYRHGEDEWSVVSASRSDLYNKADEL